MLVAATVLRKVCVEVLGLSWKMSLEKQDCSEQRFDPYRRPALLAAPHQM